MSQEKTRIVIEDNTLYEIDLECMEKKRIDENRKETVLSNRRRTQNNSRMTKQTKKRN